MDEGEDPADGRPPLRRFGAALLGLLHDHVELSDIELRGQEASALRLLLFIGLTPVSTLLLLAGLSLLVLIVFWDTSRLAATLGLCLFYVIGSLLCSWRLYQSTSDKSSPFSTTLEELTNDRGQLLPWQGNAHEPTTDERDRPVISRIVQGGDPPAPGGVAPAIAPREPTAGVALPPGPGAGLQPQPATVRR